MVMLVRRSEARLGLRRNKKGMALLLVLTSVVILSLIMVEMNYTIRMKSHLTILLVPL